MRRIYKGIVKYMRYVLKFAEKMTYAEFVNDEKSCFAVVRCIEVIGEAAKHAPDDVRKKYPEIP